MGMETFQRAEVWKKAHALALAIYRLTDAFPRQEMYGLTSQIRRAAVSVPANIAEGYRKRSAADRLRFYNIAQGSLEETRYYLILSKDLCYGDTDFLMERLDEVSRMLAVYIRRIAQTPHP